MYTSGKSILGGEKRTTMFFVIADEPRNTVARLKTRSTIRDPSMILGNYRLQNNRVSSIRCHG